MRRLFALLLLVLVSGCASSSKSFYMLTAEGPAPAGGGRGIGVGPVTVAEYLDRPNLVIQESENSLAVAEDHRWAGDLPTSVARVTATNLGRKLSTGNVRVYPWQGDDGLSNQVTLDIRQLHAGADGYAVLEAGWRVYSLPDRRLVASKTFTDREALERDGYEAMVAAESRLLGRLADEIAKSIR
ncbi:membrane integrity-associated transporter subunit PqiC [Luteolibacter pohnpeiensis]|uniref:Membrane integrity-associated transporter subunit PqiC n=1 Tax=Luteolibacter pohnpeiensis TaxID=454153 RepID=A0A934S3F3_9BACT|nr:PqiC family protein [Luteolibacter pohnpeiensis]MBK1881188.1 membrane integrity-associated transporter subunit PqiC [Luteolibacter pohnpeiensis]